MTRQHLLFGLAWLASVLAVYFAPVGDKAPSSAAKDRSNGPSSASVDDRGSALGQNRPEQTEGPVKSHAARVVAQARLLLRGGKKKFPYVALRCAALLAKLDDAEIAEALAEVEATVRDPGQKAVLYSQILARWAAADGPAAMAYFDQRPTMGSWNEWEVRQAILRVWAGRDSQAAWQWLEGNRSRLDLSAGAAIIVATFAGLAAKDPDYAFQCLAAINPDWFALPVSTGNQAALSDVEEKPMDENAVPPLFAPPLEHPKAGALRGIAESAIDENTTRRLLVLADSLPEEERMILYQGLLKPWLVRDLEGALAWILSHREEEQFPFRHAAGECLLEADPDRGAEFILETARRQVFNKTASYEIEPLYHWAGNDRPRFESWLRKQPPRAELNGLREFHAGNLAQREPEAALIWAQGITDEVLRHSVEETVRLLRNDRPENR